MEWAVAGHVDQHGLLRGPLHVAGALGCAEPDLGAGLEWTEAPGMPCIGGARYQAAGPVPHLMQGAHVPSTLVPVSGAVFSIARFIVNQVSLRTANPDRDTPATGGYLRY